MRRYWQYLKYVLRHKWFVFQECLKLGVPLWIAILHDLDKFLPDEWFPYARCFYAPDGSKQYQPDVAFAVAWMLHQHRNKHHWQYWLKVDGVPLRETDMLMWDSGKLQRVVNRNSGSSIWWELRDAEGVVTADDMPETCRREMLADWRGAGRAQGTPDTADWYLKNREKIQLHPETRAWVEARLSSYTRFYM